jgi:hypothetical protein
MAASGAAAVAAAAAVPAPAAAAADLSEIDRDVLVVSLRRAWRAAHAELALCESFVAGRASASRSGAASRCA